MDQRTISYFDYEFIFTFPDAFYRVHKHVCALFQIVRSVWNISILHHHIH
jgi:hypothetical protein